ncbi:MAG: hypothetical protein ACK4GD_11330 [Sphingomonadaceae bacterium]
MDLEILPPPQRVALGYATAATRAAWAALIGFDLRLAATVATASEPMLAQIRLAWWRETLEFPRDMRPAGDALLDALGQHLAGSEPMLTGLVEAWELILAEPPIAHQTLDRYLNLRAAAYAGLGARFGIDPANADAAARWWVLGDTLAHLSDPEERAIAAAMADSLPDMDLPLGRPMRPLAILGALGQRAVKAGGTGLLCDRSGALVALRVGIFGR